jgi:xylulokinase
MGCVLACDLGGTSFRAALVDETGRVTHLAAEPMSIAGEIDPQDWWLAFGRTAAALADSAGAMFDSVEAIAISAFTRTQVFLGREGQVMRPAIAFRDSRAEAVLPALCAALPVDDPETASINAFHPLARLYWLAIHEPDCMASLAAIVDPKDYLNFRLTGRIAIDSVAGARLIACENSLLAASGVKNVIPAVRAPTAVIGRVQTGLAGPLGRLAGRPVLAMATDTWAAALGLGALRSGFAYNLSGTTEVLGVFANAAAPADGLLTVDWGNGVHQIGGPSQNGADTLVWVLDLLGRACHPIGPTLEALLAQPRIAQPVLFLPYLQGERTPYWDPSLRGAFIGLQRGHGPSDIAHAVLEGVAFHNRIVLERAERAAGVTVAEIRFGGGGAANASWCQIKADVTNRDVVVVDEAEPGLVGAAIVACTALGRFENLSRAQAMMVTPRARFTPRPARVAFYNDIFPLFRAAEAALAPISRRLAAL